MNINIKSLALTPFMDLVIAAEGHKYLNQPFPEELKPAQYKLWRWIKNIKAVQKMAQALEFSDDPADLELFDISDKGITFMGYIGMETEFELDQKIIQTLCKACNLNENEWKVKVSYLDPSAMQIFLTIGNFQEKYPINVKEIAAKQLQ